MARAASALTRHDLEAKIVKHCWEDEGFRKEFTADPSSAFVKYLEVPAASLPRIVVHQEAAGSWHIVLPAKPANIGELSEEDLERVAGASLLPPLLGISQVISAVVGSAAASAGVTASAVVVSIKESGW
jgi:hypothetical protein